MADSNDYSYQPSQTSEESSELTKSTEIKTQDIGIAKYNEMCATFRMLTDVRFKLLALIPPVAALALTAIVSEKGPLEGASRFVRFAAAVFGLLVTAGLSIYEARNSQLYRGLVQRAQRTEIEIGIEDGVFADRDVGTRSLISHRSALTLVYGVVLIAWIAAAISVLLGAVPV